MATKKQQFAFYEDALEYILSIGARNTHKGSLASTYKVDTKAGELEINLDTPDKSEVFSIYCRFEDADRAKEVLPHDTRLNQYSGKWNFHYWDGDFALNQFKNELTNIIQN